jgi:hypothetical protein
MKMRTDEGREVVYKGADHMMSYLHENDDNLLVVAFGGPKNLTDIFEAC